MNFISVTEANALYPDMSRYDIAIFYQLDPTIHRLDIDLLYLINKIKRGKLDDAKKILESLDKEVVKKLINRTSFYMYDGTILHLLLYWNNNYSALEFYKDLRYIGANIYKDYYGDLPWKQTGSFYVDEINHVNYGRFQEDFTWINLMVQEFESNF